jgi:hypothetical protein
MTPCFSLLPSTTWNVTVPEPMEHRPLPSDRTWLLVHVDSEESIVYGPPLSNADGDGPVKVVPLAVAEKLATALERIALRSDSDVAHHDHAQRLAAKRVVEFRAAHPREETP